MMPEPAGERTQDVEDVMALEADAEVGRGADDVGRYDAGRVAGCEAGSTNRRVRGEVVKLDRKFPLVEIAGSGRVRCEHATELVKGSSERAVIGDIVEVSLPKGHTVGVIERILPRRTSFIRRDPQEREMPQVLASNFDQVLIVQPINKLNLKRLERELVLAHETGADVAVLLTKADLLNDDGDAGAGIRESDAVGAGSDGGAEYPGGAEGYGEAETAGEAESGECASDRNAMISEVRDQVQSLAGQSVEVLAMSRDDDASINRVRRLMSGKTTILIGKSGVGKSTLVNVLLGEDARATGDIRARDGKGRHTTVSREIIALPNCRGVSQDGDPRVGEDGHPESGEGVQTGSYEVGCHGSGEAQSTDQPCTVFPGGRIVDMPGVRGLGLWDAQDGIETAFSDIEEMAVRCRFRDCRHGAEPGCAVREAIESGSLSESRLASYLSLKDELSRNNERRRRSSWKNK